MRAAESSAVDAVCRYDPFRENGIAERPQTLRYPEIKIFFPLNMARAQRKPFLSTKKAAAQRFVQQPEITLRYSAE